jgi:preprotein translocase subunit SecA
MEPHMERSDAPGEWTTREVLSHLLFEPGFDPGATLSTFSERDYPMIEIDPGDNFLDDQRRKMTLSQFKDALDAQRRRVLEYIDGVEERAFDKRKARIPLFKQFMGTDEITMDMYLGAMFDYHWNDHAGQLEKIRHAVGLGSVDAAKPSGVSA